MLVLVVGATLFIYITYKCPRIIPENSDYLEALSYEIWKEPWDIKMEMEQKERGWIDPADMRSSLDKLVDEGLIKRRPCGFLMIYDQLFVIVEFKRRTDFSPLDMGIPPLVLADPPKTPFVFTH